MAELNTIFFGTPQLSVPYLELLYAQTTLQCAVTQADRPRGRGMQITPCPVKVRALELGVPVHSPEKLAEIYDNIKNTPFDLGVAVAFGKLFKPDFLALPKLGILNVHFSLLPKLRGAAPVQHSLFEDYKTTGVSIFWIAPGMDDGPLFLQKKIPVLPEDDAQSLFEKLVPLGVEALKETLQRIAAGEIVRTAQSGEPTFAPMIAKESTLIDFRIHTAAHILGRIRGLACGPKAYTLLRLNGQELRLQLLRAQAADTTATEQPGTVLAVESGHGILVKCKEGCIWLTRVQPAGKGPMDADAFARGRGLKPTAVVF